MSCYICEPDIHDASCEIPDCAGCQEACPSCETRWAAALARAARQTFAPNQEDKDG